MRVALGSDHRGLELKRTVIGMLIELGYDYYDFGCYDTNSVDYPDIAQVVSEAVSPGGFDYGVLICGTGIGMSIAANKIRGIRAALCRDVFDASRARQHNNANIVCLGGEIAEPQRQAPLRPQVPPRRLERLHTAPQAAALSILSYGGT